MEDKNKIVNKELFGYLKLIIVLLIIMFFVARLAITSGSSMNNTLYNGDFLIIEKISQTFHLDYNRFDIVIFKSYDENRPYYIKRIIGTPGDTVQIIDGYIYINGKKSDEEYGNAIIQEAGIASEEITVGEDEYFVMGDNRNNSNDSRYFGCIDKSMIVGRAVFNISRFQILI